MDYSGFIRALNAPVYESKPRLCGGHFGYVSHRFPIKGGISWKEVMVRQSFAPNPLLDLVRYQGKKIGTV